MIQAPGLYVMSEEDYRADPCPEPSLTQSVAKVLLHSCPHAAWHIHPRLNPEFAPKEEDKFNLANVAHRLLLGRGKEFRTVVADDWRSTASREQKHAIRNSGFIPILEHQLDKAASMVNAAKAYLKDHPDGSRIFKPDYGDGEMVIACWDRNGCWTRAMVDWLEHRSPNGNNFLCVDYKTTGMSANPKEFTHQQKRDWAFQAAFQKRILDHIKPGHNARFLFLVQETEEPWICSLNEPSAGAMVMSVNQVIEAIDMWFKCLFSGVWTGHEKTVFYFGPPFNAEGWAAWAAETPLPAPAPQPPAKKRGRPRMTSEQKAEARAKRKAKADRNEYLEERKEVVTNDNGRDHDNGYSAGPGSNSDGDTVPSNS